MEYKIIPMQLSEFGKEFRRLLNAKYIVNATPQRVSALIHDIHEPEKNREFAKYLKNQAHETLLALGRGELLLFDTAIIFVTNDTDHPVSFLYTFKQVMFDRKSVVQEDKIECFDCVKDVRIEGLPLSAYSLFKVLLPRFKIVIGGNQHTPHGERWSKRQIKEAIDQGFHVYLRDEDGLIYNADTYKVIEMTENYLWGIGKEHQKRLTIISVDPL